ncbi:MAG: potassium channel family protein [Acidimicrobiales bacterium]
MHALAIIIGVLTVVGVLADMINTLVTTTTSSWKWWLSRVVTRGTWRVTRTIALLVPPGRRREALLSVYAPTLVLVLLGTWVLQQIVGFALIWWGIGGISGVDSLVDDIYYSGVVFFTVGFGEVVPASTIPRFGALAEAFTGVLTTALVIGYLPALYSAYSDRERLLMTLDDGTEGRLTPTNLICAWAPDAEPERINARFREWENWVTGVLETHTTHPMLRLFRSHHEGQNWITALGVMCDAALHAQIIVGAKDRDGYWFLRRATVLFQELTNGVDLTAYEVADAEASASTNQVLFLELYQRLESHGFELIPFEEARAETLHLRAVWSPAMEYLIDALLTPRGFWGHKIGLASQRATHFYD